MKDCKRSARVTQLRQVLFAAIGLGLGASALVWTAPAQAQTTLSLGGGYTSGLDPSTFSKYWPHGYHFGVGVEEAIGKAGQAHAGFLVWHHRMPLQSDKMLEDQHASPDITIEGGTVSITEILASFRFDLTATRIRPYVLAGLGAGVLAASDTTISSPTTSRSTSIDTEVDFGLTAGIGVRGDLGGASIFCQVRYGTVFTEGDRTNYVPVTVGVAF